MSITKGSRAAHERSLKAAETRRRNSTNKGSQKPDKHRDTPAYELTRAQYHTREIWRTMHEYGISKHEAEEQPRDIDDEHYRAVRAHVQRGHTIAAKVLDSLNAGQRRQLQHDYPTVNTTYLPPEIRKRKAEFAYPKPFKPSKRVTRRK